MVIVIGMVMIMQNIMIPIIVVVIVMEKTRIMLISSAHVWNYSHYVITPTLPTVQNC
jgi:hypothetical protein